MTRNVRLVLLYTVVTVVMTWPIFNIGALASASYVGDARLIIWTLAWDNHAILSRSPLFESNIFYPARHSLIYNDHLFGISLFTLPIYAATRNPVLAYNVVWLLSFVLCGLSTHRLLLRYTKHDGAAIVGSLIYTFSFYKMLHGHAHLQQVWTWLLPLSLLWLERWFEDPTWARALLWGATAVLQALTSWYLAVMVGIAHLLVLGWRFATAVRARWTLRLVQLAVVGSIGASILWPFATRYRGLPEVSAAEAASLSADAPAYLMPAENTWPGRLWSALGGREPRSMWGERTLYLGWIALAFALVGASAIRDRTQWLALAPYVLVGVTALLLSFGPPGRGVNWSLYALATRVPGIGGFRAPARFGLLVLFGVAVFAAFGARALATRSRHGRWAVTVAVLLMLSEWFVVGFPGGRPLPFAVPEIYRRPELKSAHALVSLPDYRRDIHWFFETDYLLYSTTHWRPIVNGYGRWEPPDHGHVVSHMMAFPGPNNARTMRQLGVDYVVLHADRFPQGVAELIRVAQESSDYELIAHMGSDYLFRIK